MVIFLSSFLALSGAFMLLPLNILRLTQSPDAPLLAGLFGATSWLGIFALTPWVSSLPFLLRLFVFDLQIDLLFARSDTQH